MTRILAKRCVAILLTAVIFDLHGLSAHLWAAEAATLDGLEVGPDQVTLHLSDQVRYNSFVTAEPPRLIIELLNTEYAASGQTQGGEGKFLKRVRSAQYQREPNLITRIVLDLKELVSYRAKWDKNRLVVMLMGGESDEEPAQEEAEEAPAPAPAARAPAAPPAVSAPIPDKSAAAPAAMRDAPTPAAGEEKPASLPKRMTTTASPELSRIAMGSDLTPAGEDPYAPPRRVKPAELKQNRSRRDILATLPTDPITLDFDNTAIQDVLKLVAMKAKVNVVYGPDVTGVVTLHLSDVPFNEAFMTVLAMQGLVASQVGQNILRVMAPITLTKERSEAVTQTRVLKLNYVKADEVKVALDSVRKAEARVGTINFDKYTNSLIITDSLDGIAAAERLLAELDVRPKQVMIEVKLVEVALSRDFNVGVEWDYFSLERSEHAGKTGLDAIGTPITYPTSATDLLLNGALPIDDKAVTNSFIGKPLGAAGRGTGVFLPATNVFGAFTYGRVTNNFLLNATLTAAASRGKAKVLSDPKISAMNGEQATIDITTSIPYVTSETVQGATPTTTQKVSYTVTGIKLAVKPTINSDGSITMEVLPEVSQPSTVSASAGTTGAIATDSRKAKTIVHVNDGETFVIGGLITDTESETIAKVPLLGDIPILGWLFKKKTNTRNRTELLIFVTSKIANA